MAPPKRLTYATTGTAGFFAVLGLRDLLLTGYSLPFIPADADVLNKALGSYGGSPLVAQLFGLMMITIASAKLLMVWAVRHEGQLLRYFFFLTFGAADMCTFLMLAKEWAFATNVVTIEETVGSFFLILVCLMEGSLFLVYAFTKDRALKSYKMKSGKTTPPVSGKMRGKSPTSGKSMKKKA